MAEEPRVSLIDLSQQLPFEIDDALKKELCFGETLIISCGHYEGDIDDGSSVSEWTCRSTTSTESIPEVKETEPIEVKDIVISIPESEKKEEDFDNFHFFFFPDCKEPLPPKHSKDSIVIVEGLPQIAPPPKEQAVCTCPKDKCECFTKIPCDCGATEEEDCICHNLKDICVCDPKEIKPKCTCEEAEICICDSHKGIQPVCTCDKIVKPCVCRTSIFPSPVCKCKRKPTLPPWNIMPSISSVSEEDEASEENTLKGGSNSGEPCDCQKPDAKVICACLKDKECICATCGTGTCICDIIKPCICEPPPAGGDIPCKDQDDKSICKCAVPKICTCGAGTRSKCKCFPDDICTCGDPGNCKCFFTCDCKGVICSCDTVSLVEKACACLDGSTGGLSDIVCTCPKQGDKVVIKRKRAGKKEGYRWCRDVDPQHTFFDYAYERHKMIETKEPEPEKIVIQGLHVEDERGEEVCAVHGVKAPHYEKKIRKPSLDCCSAVGGISISIETLGEDKSKLLVQVVSHSSKEGAKTSSKLISILDCNLHTLEENRTEQITKKNLTKEKRSYMAICANGYYNKLTRICGEKDVRRRIYHTFEKAQNFLLEGANVVLMRYFGLRRYRGNVKTDTVMIDGIVCQSIYVSHGVSQAIVNGTPLFVVKVERHIIEPSGYIHQSLTVLSLRGRIVSHEWADNCYVMHINPLLKVNPEKDEIETSTPLREKWRDDMQLLSDYLDFKAVRSCEGGRYVTESGVLTGAVRDYLQAILMLRPQDTLNFTRHYFGSVFSDLDLPHDDYFDPISKQVRYYFFTE